MHLLLSTILLLAEDAPAEQPSPFSNFILLVPVLLILAYFLLLRPGQKRQDRQRQALVSNLNKNDKVITNAGIVGAIHSIQDDEIVLKLEDNAKMRMLKTSIYRNVSAEERLKAGTASAAPAAAKSEEPAKEQKA